MVNAFRCIVQWLKKGLVRYILVPTPYQNRTVLCRNVLSYPVSFYVKSHFSQGHSESVKSFSRKKKPGNVLNGLLSSLGVVLRSGTQELDCILVRIIWSIWEALACGSYLKFLGPHQAC